MPLPLSTNIENPILHELSAVGGSDNVRYLYVRLISYFPSLSDPEITAIKNGEYNYWKKAVQKAGKALDENNFIKRDRGVWSLTEKGKNAVSQEFEGFNIASTNTENHILTHREIQQLLVEIGEMLGYDSEIEFQFYDVVWRESSNSSRLSHVFEVQSKGNIDSAFAKLKRAHDAQRSKIFLILDSERDANRARKSLAHEFRELENILVLVSFVELRKIYDNLTAIAKFLPNLLRA